MEHIAALEMAWKQGASLIAELRPADFSAPTPCTEIAWWRRARCRCASP